MSLPGTVTSDGDHDAESATIRRPLDVTCSFGDWTFNARSLLKPFQVSHQRSRLAVEGEMSTYLVISPPTPVAAHEFLGPILELMDLMTLASGVPSGQIALTLIHKDDVDHPNGDGTSFKLQRRVDSFGARIHMARPTEPAVPDQQFLFSSSDIPFEDVVPAWLSIRRSAAAACNVFFGMKYASPPFTEVRLLMTAIAAEALHQSIRGDVTELTQDDFKDLRARVLAPLTDQTERKWVRRNLHNAPSFRQRMMALASIPSPIAVAVIVDDVETWADSLSDARNGLAHSGNEQTEEDIFHLERVTASLLSLVFVSELGLSEEAQDRAAREILTPPPRRVGR